MIKEKTSENLLWICYGIFCMEKGLWDGAYMRILLNGKWHVVLEDGTTGQMDLPGTLDENGIGHRDVGANQWHPDAVLGNAA